MRLSKNPNTHEIHTLFDSGAEARHFARAVHATQVKAREECMPEWVLVMTWSRAFEQATGRTSSSPADLYMTATVVAPGKILWAVLEHFSVMDEPMYGSKSEPVFASDANGPPKRSPNQVAMDDWSGH